MRRIFVTTSLFLLSTSMAEADPCLERFKTLLIEGNGDDPVKTFVTQKMNGGPETTNYFYMVKPGHWMSEMVEPANQAWTLTHDNVMYSSPDKGKSWNKVRDFDSAANQKIADENLKANAETAKNASCSEEELEGQMHEVVEGDYQVLQNFKTDNRNKYWVNMETGYIRKATYEVKAKGFDSFVTQLMEKAPDLSLPTP